MYKLQIVIKKGDFSRLEKFGETMPEILSNAMQESVQMVAAHVMEDKLLGQVLHRRSGNLLRNIRSGVQIMGSRQVLGRVYVGAGAPYGRIHEFGGVIHIPEIRPVEKQALHFYMKGREVFAMRARAHDVMMPTRSFLRSTLSERAEDALAIFKRWIAWGLGKHD